MRLKTIWTIPAMSTMERLRRTREWATMKVANRLPKDIRYWVVIQELAKASKDSPNRHIMATPIEDILKNMEPPR